MENYAFETLLLHGNIENDSGATVTPVYQTSAFKHESAESLEKLFENKKAGYCYTRLANPTVDAFEKKITALEKGFASVGVSSGMAAIYNSIINVLQAGDELLVSPSLYGGTIDLFRDLEAFGITTVYTKDSSIASFEEKINAKTKLIFAETIGNPRLDVTDIKALAALAHAHGILCFIDNTVATPYLCTPLKLGADVVIHSTSKYINGSSTAIGGSITSSKHFSFSAEKYPALADYKKFGAAAFIAKLRATIHQHVGSAMAPQTAFLNNIGIETLALRMEKACSNALKLATFLDGVPGITTNYLGLESSAHHTLAAGMLSGSYGAIITIRVGSKAKAFKLINALKIPMIVSNIGDTKTLVIHPASTIALHSNAAQKQAAGVYDDLIRISVGIENSRDLINDFAGAISIAREEN